MNKQRTFLAAVMLMAGLMAATPPHGKPGKRPSAARFASKVAAPKTPASSSAGFQSMLTAYSPTFTVSAFSAFFLFFILLSSLTNAQNRNAGPRQKKDYLVTMTTDFGTMRLILHDQTPKHKANFIKLTDEHFFDGLLFHRVIENFMIQGGDPQSRTAVAGQSLGYGDVGYQIPAEFAPNLFHRKGALAAASDGNPEKASSGCQFYVVQGRVWDDAGLEAQKQQITKWKGRQPTDKQVSLYKTMGGTPNLDGNYTVFGQVINGLTMVDSIAKQPRGPADRPTTDVKMTVSGEWIKKKKITKQFGYIFQ
jgi:peptidyl-prolyl cis-trans isomerase B (cyclophilin B)